jgi:hypothetical protein
MSRFSHGLLHLLLVGLANRFTARHDRSLDEDDQRESPEMIEAPSDVRWLAGVPLRGRTELESR